ncbi:MAG: PQQ-binding-like beta-propeller repeat protein, partial [Deltaproteobacteria bacterium]|nr:PQQ-binding-like beta-propeller repeat protein [Deltaproteobacteria bacterium]
MKMSIWKIPYKYISPLKVVLVLFASSLFFYSYGCNLSETSCSDCEGPTFYTLYAINPNGTLKWNYTTKNMSPSSPAIGLDGTIYFSSSLRTWNRESSFLYAMSPTGSVVWEVPLSNISENSPSPVIGTDGTIYAACNGSGTLCDFNSAGALQWTYVTNGFILSSPVVGSNGTIFLTVNGSLYALSPTGALQWSDSTDSFSSAPAEL